MGLAGGVLSNTLTSATVPQVARGPPDLAELGPTPPVAEVLPLPR